MTETPTRDIAAGAAIAKSARKVAYQKIYKLFIETAKKSRSARKKMAKELHLSWSEYTKAEKIILKHERELKKHETRKV